MEMKTGTTAPLAQGRQFLLGRGCQPLQPPSGSAPEATPVKLTMLLIVGTSHHDIVVIPSRDNKHICVVYSLVSYWFPKIVFPQSIALVFQLRIVLAMFISL